MQGKGNCKLANILAVALLSVAAAHASTYRVLHSFGPPPDGGAPEAGLVLDPSGNLYGTTIGGGAKGNGTVYELSPTQGGGWSEKVIYSFTGGADGSAPVSTPVLDANGNLYGTTEMGGSQNKGVVFELLRSGGTWTETVLCSFTGGADGEYPVGGVIFDGFGDLIGTTLSGGGANRFGVVFQLMPSGSSWTETVIHAFTGGTDQANPRGKLSMDRVGRIYGTTSGLNGSVYRLARGSGRWHYHQLWCFCNGGGETPYGGVAIDHSYHVYGTTYVGTNGLGNVFRLTLSVPPVVDIIYAFTGKADGSNPEGGVVLDAAGTIWGTASFGGSQGHGVVFDLSVVHGRWTEDPIHSFGSVSPDGASPVTDLIFDAAGNLYGTTLNGGANGAGVVFELTP